jgi:hypothetical protein
MTSATAACLICSAQATVYCKNDDAFLCAACDASSHAGPLAARHLRVPACEACNAGVRGAAAPPADCVSAVVDTAVATVPVGVVPPAVELPTNQVMDKDALAKSIFGKDLEVRRGAGSVGWRWQRRQDPVGRVAQMEAALCIAVWLLAPPSLLLAPPPCSPASCPTRTTPGLWRARQHVAGPPGHGL